MRTLALKLFKDRSLDLWQILKIIEWILISFTAISTTMWTRLYHLDESILTKTIVITVLFLLSLIPPIDRPIAWQRAYILIALAVSIIGDGIYSSFYTLTSFILLKSCLLLPKRDAILAAAIAGTMFIFTVWLRIPVNFLAFHQQICRMQIVLDNSRVASIILLDTLAHIANCCFILIPGFVWVEEQRSRKRAEKLTKEVEILAADLERNRIAQDIHDALGHSLTTLDIQLELAQKIYDRDPDRAAKSIDIAKEFSSKCLEDVRYALRAIHRSHFDLDRAIATSIERFRPDRHIQIRYHLEFPQLPAQIGHQLYCVVLESLTNIQKYANASEVWICGTSVPDGILLTIEDNGTGFDLELPRAGFGLNNMRDRILSLGGQFSIDSSPNVGTTIRAFVPLPVDRNQKID